MAGERHLIGRAEDPQARLVAGLRRRLHENGLGEVELAGDGEHARVAQSVAVEDDGELVAGERLLREDVENGVAAGQLSLTDRFRLDALVIARRAPAGFRDGVHSRQGGPRLMNDVFSGHSAGRP
jgi:hypothetical protein